MTSVVPRLRLGIVGCGAIVRQMHLPTALRLSTVSVTALVDPDVPAAAVLAAAFAVPRFAARLAEVAADVDAVIIATPPHVRPALAREAFASGLHVLCEKPLANTVAECAQMVSAARTAGRVLAVGHMCRFFPVREALPTLCARHGLGAIRRVVATEGKPYDWPTATGYTVRRDVVPGGVMINAGIHTLDSLLWWFGDPVSIRYQDDSVGGLESNVRLEMTLADGVEVHFRQSRTCVLPYVIRIETEHGQLVLGTTAVDEYSVVQGGRSTVHRCGPAAVTQEECWLGQLADFVGSVQGGTSPRVDGTEGSRVIRLVEACYRQKQARLRPAVLPQPGLTW
jgi:predicted dehydrogenase